MAQITKEYRIIKSNLKGRSLYTIRTCSVDKQTGEILGYDSNSTVTGISPEHLLDLLKEMATRVKGNRVIDETKLKKHLNLDAITIEAPKISTNIIPTMLGHQDVNRFVPQTVTEEVIMELYYLALHTIQDILRLRANGSEDLIKDLYQVFHEELLVFLLDLSENNTEEDE